VSVFSVFELTVHIASFLTSSTVHVDVFSVFELTVHVASFLTSSTVHVDVFSVFELTVHVAELVTIFINCLTINIFLSKLYAVQLSRVKSIQI
jgi:hypothetical protein